MSTEKKLQVKFVNEEVEEQLRDTAFGYATEGSAGLDVIATRVIRNTVNDVWYGIGIGVTPPAGTTVLALPRGSVSETQPRVELANSVGLVDPDYTGEIQFRFNKRSRTSEVPYKIGDRIGQLLVVPYIKPELQRVDELENTARGEDGFGSTGK